jgi:type I restriction enzyme S subunit
MKKGWETKKLGEICSFVRGPFGGSLKKNIFKTEGYAVYEQQHAIYDQFDDIRYFIDEVKFKEMKRFELNSGDLIMSCSGTMGKMAIVPEKIKKGIINQALLKLTPSKNVTAVFLKLWMQSESFQKSLKQYSGGAAIQNVASVSILKGIEIPLPPLPEQQRIVSILDTCFEAIENAKSNAERNLQNAKELFESYLNGVFENKGEGWEERTLGEVCIFENGDRGKNYPNKSHRVEKGCPFINAGHLNDNKIDFSEMDYISEERLKLLGNGKIQQNDILFCLRGSLGKVANVGNLENGAIASSLVILRVREELDNAFLLYFLNSRLTSKQIVDFGNGAAQPNLSAGSLKKFIIPMPSALKAQQIIVLRLDELKAETKKLEANYNQKLNDLEELKKSILQKAFSGELITDTIEIPS